MKIKPIGSNQTELHLADGRVVLFSYETPVALHVPGEGYYRTSERYSVTTSKHVNRWTNRTVKTIDADKLAALVG